MTEISSLPPIVNRQARVLILGSMPGARSLQMRQYYAHPQNHFWPLVFALFDQPQPAEYAQKVAFLLKKRIALWDVLESCRRQGSSDASIINEKVNDLVGFLHSYPSIKTVIFNGSKAYELFRRNFGFEQFPLINFLKFPSTSPANTQKLAQKLERWKILKESLT